MRTKVQFNCVECKRKKIKCDRLQPCSNCRKSSKYCFYISKKRNLMNLEGGGDKSDMKMSRYHINKDAKLELRWSKLVNTFDKIVNWCQNDPKLEFILSTINSETYSKLFGEKLESTIIRPKQKISLSNASINSSITSFVETLILISMQFSEFFPCTTATVKNSYTKSGLNSYLINAICAGAFPIYMMKCGAANISAKDNLFYVRALYLINNDKTSIKELILGTVYLLQTESNYDSIWPFLVHLKKLSSLLFQVKISNIDSTHSVSVRKSFDSTTCEMRNSLWIFNIYEVSYSVFALTRSAVKYDAKSVHAPHPDLDFAPGPFDPTEEFVLKGPKLVIQTPYQEFGHFNSLAQSAWLFQCINSILNTYLDLSKNISSKRKIIKLLKKLQTIIDMVWVKHIERFNFEKFEENLKLNPLYYASTGFLFLYISAHLSYTMCLLTEAKFFYYLKKKGKASESKSRARSIAKTLIQFFKRTIKLPNYPAPSLNLTEYYMATLSIMRPVSNLIRVFIPVQNDEDLKILQYLIDFVRFYEFYRPGLKYYVEWCESQVNTNGDLSKEQKIKIVANEGLKLFFEDFW